MGVFDEEELFKYSEQEAARDSEESPLSSAAFDYQADYLKKVSEREKASKDLIDQVEAAKKKLLAPASGPSGREVLRGIAQKLTAPKESTDPRFFERRNLYTFLRDVGQYGTEQEQKQKETEAAKKEQLKALEDLASKYKYQGAKESEEAAFRALKEFSKPAKENKLVASAQEILDLESIIANSALPERVRKTAESKINALNEKRSPEANSRLDQYLRARRMSQSEDPNVRADGINAMRYLEGGGGQLTPIQKRSDSEILDARDFIKGIPQAQIDMAFMKGQHRNSRQNDIVKAYNLSKRKTLAETVDSGAVAPSGSEEDESVIDEEMP
jgi:uncharacterized protein (UPF0147 family)